MKSNASIYVNMITSLLVLVAGIAAAIMFPDAPTSYRWGIGLFAVFYFIIRMSLAIQAFKRNNHKESGSLHDLIENGQDNE